MSTREVVRSLELGEVSEWRIDIQGVKDGYSFRGFSGCCELTEDMVSDVADVSQRCLEEARKIGVMGARALG